MEKYSAKAIFNAAEGYRQAAGVLTAAFYSGQQAVMPAAWSCDAMALELYFKALLTIENGGFKRGNHNLLEYFYALPNATKAKIEEYATTFGTARVDKMNSTLPPGEKKFPDFEFGVFSEAMKSSYVRFRYPYEFVEKSKKNPPSSPVIWVGSPFIYAVKRTIAEARPDWGVK